MVFCSQCGHSCSDTARFCPECGAKLVAPSGGSASTTTTASTTASRANPKSNEYLPGSMGDMGGVEGTLARAAGLNDPQPTLYSHTTRGPASPAGTCRGCGREITGQHIKALNVNWHNNCFKCHSCNEVFNQTGNKRVLEKDGFPYCESCFDTQFGEPCAGCGRGVGQGGVIKAVNKTWHPDCFRCSGCNKKFDSPGVYNKGGKPYCKQCAGA